MYPWSCNQERKWGLYFRVMLTSRLFNEDWLTYSRETLILWACLQIRRLNVFVIAPYHSKRISTCKVSRLDSIEIVIICIIPLRFTGCLRTWLILRNHFLVHDSLSTSLGRKLVIKHVTKPFTKLTRSLTLCDKQFKSLDRSWTHRCLTST